MMANLFGEIGGKQTLTGNNTPWSVPSKLSDLKNDLYGKERVEFLRVNTSQFIISEVQPGMFLLTYEHPEMIEWNINDNDRLVGFEVKLKDGTIIDEHMCYIEVPQELPNFYTCLLDNVSQRGIAIGNGSIIDLTTQSIKHNNKLNILQITDDVNYIDSIIIYRIDTKKIPIGLFDTKDIEAAIDKVIGMVQKL